MHNDWGLPFEYKQIRYFFDLINSNTVINDSIQVFIDPFRPEFLNAFTDPAMKFDSQMGQIINDHAEYFQETLKKFIEIWALTMNVNFLEENIEFSESRWEFKFWAGYYDYLASVFSAKYEFYGVNKFLRFHDLFITPHSHLLYVKKSLIDKLVKIVELENLDVDVLLDYVQLPDKHVYKNFTVLLLSTAKIDKDDNSDYNHGWSSFAEIMACIFTLIGVDKLKKYEGELKWMIDLEKNIKCNFWEKYSMFSEAFLSLDDNHPTRKWFSQLIAKRWDFWILYYKSVESKREKTTITNGVWILKPVWTYDFSYGEKSGIFQVGAHKINVLSAKSQKQLIPILINKPYTWISYEYISGNTNLESNTKIEDTLDKIIYSFCGIEKAKDSAIAWKMKLEDAKLIFYYSSAKGGIIMFCPTPKL